MRRLLKWLAILAAALLLLSAAGYLFVRSAYFQGLIKAEVTRRVEEALNARLSIARVSGNPFYGLSFHGVRLSLPDGGEVLSARRVRVRYFLPGLLWGEGAYNVSVRLDEPYLNAVRDAEGRFNLQRLLKPRVGPKRVVNLRPLSIEEGRVRLALYPQGEPEAAPREYALAGLDYRGAALVTTGPATDVRVRLERASFALTAPERLEVKRLSGSLRAAPRRSYEADLLAETAASVVRLGLETPDNFATLRLAARTTPLELAELRGLVPALPDQGRLTARLALAGPRGELDTVAALALRGASLEATGTLDLTALARPAYDLAARLRGLDPAALAPAAARLAGRLDLDLNIEGRGLSPQELEAEFAATVLPSTRLGRYDVREGLLAGSVSGGALTLEEADVRLPFGRVVATGRLASLAALGRGELEAQLSGSLWGFDMAPLTGRRGLASDLNASFEANYSRRPQRPAVASASLELRESTVAGRRVEAGSLSASLRNGALEVSRLRLSTPLVNLTGRGTFSDSRLEADFEAATPDLGPLARALRPETREAAGRLSVRGSLAGTLASINAQAELSGSGLRYGPVSAKTLSGELAASNLRQKTPRASLNLLASSVSAGGQDIDTLRAEAEVAQERGRFTLEALADGRSLRLAGTATNLTASGADLRLAEVRLEHPRLTLTNTRPLLASVSPRGVRLSDIALVSSDGTLRLTGSLGTYTPLDLRLELAALPLEDWLPEKTPLAGRASGAVTLGGTPAGPRLSGRLMVSQAMVRGPQERRYPLERAEATFGYAPERLSLAASLVYQGDTLSAGGSVPVRFSLSPLRAELAERGLDLTLRAQEADLAPLAAILAPKAEVAGRFSATVAATGNPRQPEVRGRAAVMDASLKAPGLPETLRNIQGQAAFDRDRLTIERLSAQTEGGRAQLRGTVGLRGDMPLDLVVETAAFRVSLPEDSGWARVDAALSLTGTRVAPTVEGLIEVDEARVSIPERLTPSLREIRVVETPEDLKRPEKRREEGPLATAQRNVAIDVAVLADRRVYVRGRGLDAELRLNLEAVKEREGSLRVLGTADVIRGTYSLRGKRFALERGQALFKGLPQPNPDLSARLTYEVQQTTIVVTLSGTLNRPDIQFSSEPPMDQTNVYSYLFFGRPADRLGAGEGGVLQQQVASLVGGAAARELTSVLGEQLALDTLELTPAEGELGIEAISVGKYLTRDLFITFERGFGVEAENRIVVDYRISRRFTVQSQFGSERATGFDLFWNYDFSHLTR